MSNEVPALRAALRVMVQLCESRDAQGVTELGKALGLNKNMVFRILRTLDEEGWVVRENESAKYRMSLRPFHYASMPVGRMNLRLAALEPLKELWTRTGESTYLAILDEDRVMYLENFDATGSIKIAGKVGGRYFLHCSAPGKALIAYAPDAYLEDLARKGFERLTPKSICRLDKLRDDLALVRERGFAVDIEEYATGLMCLAAPVFDHTGRAAGTVGTSVLTLNYSVRRMLNELGPLVKAAARTVSSAMGASEKVLSTAPQK
ncbi:MAG: IclR family transcriptional regulator [Planctomycetota bacterium]|nr:IclR family transcriptional regulator [Planctomycetota bacterium]